MATSGIPNSGNNNLNGVNVDTDNDQVTEVVTSSSTSSSFGSQSAAFSDTPVFDISQQDEPTDGGGGGSGIGDASGQGGGGGGDDVQDSVQDAVNEADERREDILENPFVPTDIPPDWDSQDPLQLVELVNLRPETADAVDGGFNFLEDGFNATDGTNRTTCQLVDAIDLFQPPPYHASERLDHTNEMAFRFGAPNNMMAYLEGSSADQETYIKGLTATSVIFAAIFVVWVLFILLLKGRGYKRVGFLCGRFVRPTKPKTSPPNVSDGFRTIYKKTSSSSKTLSTKQLSSKKTMSSATTLSSAPSAQQLSTATISGSASGSSGDVMAGATSTSTIRIDVGNGGGAGGSGKNEEKSFLPLSSQTTKPSRGFFGFLSGNRNKQQQEDDDPFAFMEQPPAEESPGPNGPGTTAAAAGTTTKTASSSSSSSLPNNKARRVSAGSAMMAGISEEQSEDLGAELPEKEKKDNDNGVTASVLMDIDEKEREKEQEAAPAAAENYNDESMNPVTEAAAAFRSDDGVDDIDSEEYQAWRRECEEQLVRVNRTRIVLILLCLVNVTCGILFCVYGERYVSQSIVTTQDSLVQLQNLCLGGIQLIDDFSEQEVAMEAEFQEWLVRLNQPENSCQGTDTANGDEPLEPLCGVISPVLSVESCALEDLPFGIGESVKPVFELAHQNQTWRFRDSLVQLRDSLDEIYQEVDTFASANVELEWSFWVAFGFTILLGVCCLVIIYGIWRSQRGRFTTCMDHIRHRFLLPVFATLVLLAFGFAVAFLIATVAASDWCLPNPEDKVLYLLEKKYIGQESSSSNVLYQYITYYVNSCDPDIAPEPITLNAKVDSYIEDLQDVILFSDRLHSIPEEVWLEECSLNQVTLWLDYADLIERALCLMTGTYEDLTRFFWCRQWAPVYNLLMHEAICNEAQTGLTWVAATMAAITFCSFVILMLRAGAFEIIEECDYLLEQKRQDRCCYLLCCGFWCCSPCYRPPSIEAAREDADEVLLEDGNESAIPIKTVTLGSHAAAEQEGGRNNSDDHLEKEKHLEREKNMHDDDDVGVDEHDKKIENNDTEEA